MICASCGGSFPRGEVITLAEKIYCVACKSLAVQRLREGVVASTDAEAVRTKFLKHEASVKSIGFLYYLGGVGMLLVGIASLALGSQASGADWIMGAFFLTFGLGQLFVGTGLRRLKKWARIPTGILSGIGLIGFPIGTIINAYILYLVFSKKGGMVFSDEYHAVIQQTPHIKYRTSIVIWILLGLLVLLIVAGVGIFFGRR